MLQQSPFLSPHEREYAHHIVACICPSIQNVNYSGDCAVGAPDDVKLCRSTEVLGAWAVGGQVS